METHKIDIPTIDLGKTKLLKGKVKKIIVKKYYNLDGQIIDEGTDTFTYDKSADFEIESSKKKMWEFEYDWWTILVNGENIGKEWELTSYNYDKEKQLLILKGCTGEG